MSTDVDGSFTIRFIKNKAKGSMLVFSFIGMQYQEVVVTSSTRLDISLKEDSQLEAVVLLLSLVETP